MTLGVIQDTRRAVRLDSLTSLRFFAALLVFFRHLVPALQDAHAGLAASLLLHANVGVSFFFVLSGFVLTWSARDGDTRGRFYQRRFARVWPSHAVTWAIAIVLLVLVGQTISPFTAGANLLLLQSWFPDQSIFLSANSVSWSLSCEMLFYLAFPSIIPALRRLGQRALLATVVVAAAIPVLIGLASANADMDFSIWVTEYLPLSRVPEFVIGICAALLVVRGWLPRIPLWLGVAIAVVGYAAASIPGKLAMLPEELGFVAVTVLPMTVLIISAAQSDRAGRRTILHSRPLVALGEWSFAFYLVHFMVIQTATNAGLFRDSIVSVVLTGGACLIVSTGAAAALHYRVERPLNKRLSPSRPRRRA